MRIMLLHRGFSQGGAERQVAVTAAELQSRGHKVLVVVFNDGDAYRALLQRSSVEVRRIGRVRALLLFDLVRTVRAFRPDFLVSYLAGANLLALAVRTLRRRPKLIWGVRSTSLDLKTERRVGRFVYRAEPRMSRLCDAVVSNSRAGMDDALERGFHPPRFAVIPNGIELPRVAEHQGAEKSDERPFLIGFVGRLYKTKGLPLLLQALREVPDARLIVAGAGAPDYDAEMRVLAREFSISDRVTWLGSVDRPDQVYESVDILVSASLGEGFSNVIAEAMAYGVPCVVTDVGDSALLVGGTGVVIPPNDPAQLAAAIGGLAELPSEALDELGSAARSRIESEYSVERLGERLESFLSALLLQEGDR